MTCTLCSATNTLANQAVEPSAMTELVRGNEQFLLEHLTPLVRRQSVTLDLQSVQRIDAAGVAALISLYSKAREAGHLFSVSNASPRVVEILALVGLDGILLSQNAVQSSQSGSRMELSAA